MKLSTNMQLFAMIAFSALLVLALAFVMSEPTGATTNWPKNQNGDPDPFADVTVDDQTPENNIYDRQDNPTQQWLVETGDNISYSMVEVLISNDIRIQDGAELGLENVQLTFNDTDGESEIILEGDAVLRDDGLVENHVIWLGTDLLIDSDTTYSLMGDSTTITIEGDVIIESGATLTLDGVILASDSTYAVRMIYIEEGGSLVLMNGAQLNNLNPSVGEDFIEPTLIAEGTLDASDSTINNHGIYIAGDDSMISACTVTTSNTAPFTSIMVESNATIEDTEILSAHGKGVGIHIVGEVMPTISGNTFTAGSSTGFQNGNPILVEGMADPMITQNKFGGGTKRIESYCVRSYGSEPQGNGMPLVDDNTFDPDNAPRHFEVFWYIIVSVIDDNNEVGVDGATVDYEEEAEGYMGSETTEEDGTAFLMLPDYKITKTGTADTGSCDINASFAGVWAFGSSDVTGNDFVEIRLDLITYDYWPEITSDFVVMPMTKGKMYTLDYVIYNEGYSLEGEVEANFYVGGVMLAETDMVLVDEEVENVPTKIVQLEIMVPADADTSTTLMVKLIFTEDQDMTNNEVTVNVTLNEAPMVTIDNLAMDDVADGEELIEGSYSDDVEVTIVEIRVNGGLWIETAWDAGDWSYNWDTTGLSNGMHSIEVMATDNLGIMSDIVLINLTLENLPLIDIAMFSDDLDDVLMENFINGENQGDSVDITGTTTVNMYSENDINTVHLTIMKHQEGSLDGHIIVDDVTTTQIGGTWENWEYTWTGINSLADGMYDIVATVSDDQDYNDTKPYTVLLMADNFDSNPTVATEIPTDVDYELTEAMNTISGTAADDYELQDVMYRLGDNEEDPWTSTTGTDEWEFEIAKTELAEGETKTVYIKAFDGQAYSDPIAINLKRGEPQVDLAVTSVVVAADAVAKEGVSVTVTVTITMSGATAVDKVDIKFYIGTVLAAVNTTSINKASTTIPFTFTPTAVHVGQSGITVKIDQAMQLDDTDRSNNNMTNPAFGPVKKAETSDDDDDDDTPGFEIAVIAFVICTVAVVARRRKH